MHETGFAVSTAREGSDPLPKGRFQPKPHTAPTSAIVARLARLAHFAASAHVKAPQTQREANFLAKALPRSGR